MFKALTKIIRNAFILNDNRFIQMPYRPEAPKLGSISLFGKQVTWAVGETYRDTLTYDVFEPRSIRIYEGADKLYTLVFEVPNKFSNWDIVLKLREMRTDVKMRYHGGWLFSELMPMTLALPLTLEDMYEIVKQMEERPPYSFGPNHFTGGEQ